MKLIPVLVAALLFTLPASGDIVTQAVAYEHDGVELEGFLAYDDAIPEGQVKPGVLLVHAWWGLGENTKNRAKMLAELGYVAFALDMYGKGKHTDAPAQASQWAGTFYGGPSRFGTLANAGLEQLKKQPHVDTDRIAAIGYCFGGTTVMQLAYSGADIQGVVSFHGSLLPPQPDDLDDVQAKALICHGQADTFFTTAELLPIIDTLQEAGVDTTTAIYSGAEHAFTDNTTKIDLDGASYNEDADQRSWDHMQSFFSELFSAE